MHPLSLFPNLLTFGLLSPTIIRLTAGIFLFLLGIEIYKKPIKWMCPVYFILGITTVIGLYTQAVVLLSIILLVIHTKVNKDISKEKRLVIFFAEIMFLSLLFTGPGFLAFDLPL